MANTCCDDTAFLEQQLTAVEAAISAYRAAVLALGTGGVQSYTLDTGQTRQTVTKANLTEMRRAVDSMMNERAVLRAQLGCGGHTYVVPGF